LVLQEKRFWTEWFFSYFPIDKKNLSQQLLARLAFLFSVWVIGFATYAFDGLSSDFLSEPVFSQVFGALITSYIILFGGFHVQTSLKAIIPKLNQILCITETEFLRFTQRLERFSFSFIPCLLLGVGFIIFMSGTQGIFQSLLSEGFKLHIIWMLFFNVLASLLIGTAFWMFAVIWLTIFLVSRQPLVIELSDRTNERFRDLSRLALIFALFYFISISLTVVISSRSVTDAISLVGVLTSIPSFYILFGVIGILFPFYSIHMALLKLKNNELSKVRWESEKMIQELDEILLKEPLTETESIYKTIIQQARITSLKAKERRIQETQEWPIDVTFISRLFVLVLIPILARIAVEILHQFF